MARAPRRRPATRRLTTRASKGLSISPTPTFRAFRCTSPTSTSRCRRTFPATNTGSTAGSITARSRRGEHGDAASRGATMLTMILKRAAMAIPSLIGVVIVTFLLTRALPGDPAAYFAGPAATPQAIQEVRVKLGLDKPLIEQFGRYVVDLGHGNLG